MEVLALAAAQWHEAPVLTGPASQGKLSMEFLVSLAGTWTVILTRPDDVACIVASGTDLMLSGEIPLHGEEMSFCTTHKEQWRDLGEVIVKECNDRPRRSRRTH